MAGARTARRHRETAVLGPIDRARFDVLFDRWMPRVHGWLLRHGCTRLEAEAATARAMVDALARLPQALSDDPDAALQFLRSSRLALAEVRVRRDESERTAAACAG